MSARKTTARPRRRRASSFGRGVATILGYVTLLVLVSMVVGIVFVAGVFRKVAEDLPSPDTLLNYNPGGITEIYATDKDPRTGKNVLLGRVFSQNKEFVPITQIPAVLKNATIAIEDHRFFSHPGVDLQGIARAVYVNARGGRLLEGQGGSTLTQQLARNIYLTQKKTLSRKAQEIMLAIQIEKNYSKQQILEMYLNEVYYGAGAYGVQAASKVYFGKPVKDLSLSQAALLAGLPQQPSRFDPFVDKKASIARRNTVLAKMAELGYITPQKSKVAQSNGVFLIPPRPKNDGEFKAPYFTNYVIRQLVERYGHEVVYTGGLKVYTTLNWKMQQSAEAALVEGVRRGRRARVTQGALISLEPRTGYIRAMVGGVDFKENQYNNAVQGRRQPGSSFKVIVYTAAFDTNQYGPDSRVNDAPFSLRTGKGKWWRPQNYGGGYRGWVSVRQAMTYSYNTPAVRVVDKIGPSTVISYARKMGIMSPLQPYVPIALGSDAVSPLEMAAAYSIFPNYGNRAEPMSIIRVVNHQREVLEENRPSVRRP
jgi:penicillin-binding protein 1A